VNAPSNSAERARRWLTLGIPILVLLVGYLPFLLFRSELPDPVASHFDASGQPDAAMPIRQFVLVNSVMMFLGLALCVWLGLRRRTLPEGSGPIVGFMGGLLAAMGAGILTSTTLEQRDIELWSDAPSVYGSMTLVMLAAMALGAFGAWCGARTPGREPARTRQVPAMSLAGNQQAVWSATIRSTPVHIGGVATLLIGLALLWLVPPLTGAIVVLTALLMLGLATVRLRIDRHGLLVKYGNFPWPVTRIELENIANATVVDVEPMQWGGWGYRGNLTVADQAAVVMRAGPGLRTELVDGKVFVITVDNPEQGAALLNAQLKRQRGPG